MIRPLTALSPVLLVTLWSCGAEPAGAATGQKTAAPAKVEAKEEQSPDPLSYNLDAAGAAKLLADNDEVVILDVRTPGEYSAGHLEGAVNIDYKADDFIDRIKELDRDKTYLLHCRSGGRSTAAYGKLHDLGFAQLYHLDGGTLAWEAAGQPMVK